MFNYLNGIFLLLVAVYLRFDVSNAMKEEYSVPAVQLTVISNILFAISIYLLNLRMPNASAKIYLGMDANLAILHKGIDNLFSIQGEDLDHNSLLQLIVKILLL